MKKVKLHKAFPRKDEEGNWHDIAPHNAGKVGILQDNGLVAIGNVKYKFNKKFHEIL